MKKNFDFLKTTTAKTLMSNFASLSALQLVNIILPLLTLPYLLRVLGVNNYGIVILAASLVNYFHSITDYSFKITATRDIALSRESQTKMSLIYSRVMTIKFLILVVSVILLSLIIFLYPPFFEERLTFLLTIPMLLGHVLFPEWFFQGIEKMKYITYLNVGVKVFFTICIFLFITSEMDYWLYPLLYSSGYIVSGVLGQLILIRKYNLKFHFISWSRIKNVLKENFAIFVNQFLPNLYNNSTTFLLGIIINPAAVGVYDALKKVIDLGIMLINIVSRTVYPYLNRNKQAFTTYKKWMFRFGILMSMMPILFSYFIFWYLNIYLENRMFILSVLSCGIFFISVYDIFGVNYLIIHRKDKIVMMNTIKASFLGLFLAFPLIYFFGILGAAANLTIARGVMGLGLYMQFLKIKNKDVRYA